MTRVDDDNMDMEKMDILLKGEADAKDLSVKLRTAIYHMPAGVLKSDKRSRVSRDDFQIEGDSLVFDTHTQQGKMVGHVQMIIFDADTLKGKPADAPKAGEKTDAQPEKKTTDGTAAREEKKETK